jgi:hypothetical protein
MAQRVDPANGPSADREVDAPPVAMRAPRRRAARVVIALACVALLGLLVLDRVFPLPAAALAPGGAPGTVLVLAVDGTPLRSWASRDGALRHPTSIEAVSPRYLEALLQVEDRWFAWHPGVNPLAMARAAWQWLRAGRVVSGGSTLTMQVARILDPPAGPSRTAAAKLRQIARALQLEARLDKREILALYLNHAPMGGQVEGVEAAARGYLGKSARELSHAEAALLVALPQMPSRLRPDRAPVAARAARDRVLERMRVAGVWSPEVVADARLESVFAPPLRARWLAPLAAERVRARDAAAPSDAAGREARVLPTLIDAAVQAQLERMLQDRLATLPAQVSVAALVVDNRSLAVLGYAGSADFADEARAAHVDMVRAVRSPGSTLKPFLYAMALDDGLVHSESLLTDAPQAFGDYAPGNFQAAFAGPVSVSEALQRSLNVPAVDLLDRIGPARFAARLREAGLRVPGGAEPNLSLVLGGAGTTLEELVGAYTALARDGVAGRPRLQPGEPLLETRLMSRHELRLSRRLGDRRHGPSHRRRVGRAPRRHAQPGPFRREHRSADGARPDRRARADRQPAEDGTGRCRRQRDLLAAGSGRVCDPVRALPGEAHRLDARGHRAADAARPDPPGRSGRDRVARSAHRRAAAPRLPAVRWRAAEPAAAGTLARAARALGRRAMACRAGDAPLGACLRSGRSRTGPPGDRTRARQHRAGGPRTRRGGAAAAGGRLAGGADLAARWPLGRIVARARADPASRAAPGRRPRAHGARRPGPLGARRVQRALSALTSSRSTRSRTRSGSARRGSSTRTRR